MISLKDKFLKENIPFELYDHRAIYTNEDALVVKKEQGFTGTETKSLFLKDKKDNYYIYLTFTTKKSDFKKVSKLMAREFFCFSRKNGRIDRLKTRCCFSVWLYVLCTCNH